MSNLQKIANCVIPSQHNNRYLKFVLEKLNWKKLLEMEQALMVY